MADEVGYGTPESRKTTSGDKTFVERAWDVQNRLEQRTKRFGAGRYARVLKMARKPEPEEFRRTAIITGIGLFIMGAIGFGIFLLMELLFDVLKIQ